jgi:formate hydrogenlyase subunit 3/multisubunit Na+/H+ antiporter MnhD subunit
MELIGFLLMIGIPVLILFSPIFFIRAWKRKKYFERLESMNPQQRQLEMSKLQGQLSKYDTSHVLHFLLSVICLGMWIIPWVLIAQSNASQKRKIEKLMDNLVQAAS